MIENELSSVGHDIISCFLCGLCVGLGKGLVCWCEDSTLRFLPLTLVSPPFLLKA